MSSTIELRTPRLRLRSWLDSDLEPFAAMNGDPRVMEHFPSLLDRAASDAMVGRIRALGAEDGFGLWAVEAPGVAPFIGFVGLTRVRFEAPFTPAVEIGWRLAAAHWGRGYAPEAAAEALRFGFEERGLAEVVSMTVGANARSQRVMQKLGMRRDPSGDFDHPRIAEGSPLRRHVLYRLSRGEWAAGRGPGGAARSGNEAAARPA